MVEPRWICCIFFLRFFYWSFAGWVLNLFIVLVNIYYLIKMNSAQESFKHLSLSQMMLILIISLNFIKGDSADFSSFLS